MTKQKMHARFGRPTSTAPRNGQVPGHWVLAAVLASLPVVASGPQGVDEEADTRPAERIEAAPVVPQTELEAAAISQTALEDAPVVSQTELEDAPVVPMTEIEEIVVTGSRLARTPGELAGTSSCSTKTSSAPPVR